MKLRAKRFGVLDNGFICAKSLSASEILKVRWIKILIRVLCLKTMYFGSPDFGIKGLKFSEKNHFCPSVPIINFKRCLSRLQRRQDLQDKFLSNFDFVKNHVVKKEKKKVGCLVAQVCLWDQLIGLYN